VCAFVCVQLHMFWTCAAPAHLGWAGVLAQTSWTEPSLVGPQGRKDECVCVCLCVCECVLCVSV
jgi:hypothetical protein